MGAVQSHSSKLPPTLRPGMPFHAAPLAVAYSWYCTLIVHPYPGSVHILRSQSYSPARHPVLPTYSFPGVLPYMLAVILNCPSHIIRFSLNASLVGGTPPLPVSCTPLSPALPHPPHPSRRHRINGACIDRHLRHPRPPAPRQSRVEQSSRETDGKEYALFAPHAYVLIPADKVS